MESRTSSEIFENRLFDAEFFAVGLLEEGKRFFGDRTMVLKTFQDNLASAFNGIDNWGNIEANVRTKIILPILKFLDWPFLEEKTYSVQGRQLRPDYVLFHDEASADAPDAGDIDSTEKRVFLLQSEAPMLPKGVEVFLEAKAADKKLDTAKARVSENPYLQLLDYLNNAGIDRGFLCNGRELWLVDASSRTPNKRYVKVDLEALAKEGTPEDWQVFMVLFARRSHVELLPAVSEKTGQKTLFQRVKHLDWEQKTLSECELRNVIYGTDGNPSMIELIGKALYRAALRQGKEPAPAKIFANAQFLAFRLLFLAFFESKYLKAHVLPRNCAYADTSLWKIFQNSAEATGDSKGWFSAWRNLQMLFCVIDKGDQNLFIPLFNGGLFSDENAPMLAWPRILNNREIHEILKMLFLYEDKRRDFSALSVTQLGTIYEGLLGFEFRIASEKIWYLDYKTGGKGREEGYYSLADYAKIKANKKVSILSETKYEKGDLYFVGSSNSRKTTASYYTPSSLSAPLVKRAIDHLLDNLDKDRSTGKGKDCSILDVRILDSACGSGHLLVESLNYLTSQALSRIDNDPRLKAALDEEKSRIAEEFKRLELIADGEEQDIDEMAILKRILLKKNIYGVDLHPFSVELTCLSLWIETFIFGTPLSFLAHHIKHGNSLVGCSRSKFDQALSDAENKFGLSREKYQQKRTRLFELYQKLSSLRDTTVEDLQDSKRIYREEILHIIEEMNLFFDCVTMKEFKMLQGQRTLPCMELFESIDAWLHKPDSTRGKEQDVKQDKAGQKLVDEIHRYKEEYAFFNWQLEFPEAFANGGTSGFHVIIGNPPWDKTKFSDADFFSQFSADYRTASNSRKAEIQADVLCNAAIARRYENEKEGIRLLNEYYKKSFPRNAGTGDGNLFRFFVERSLGLLKPGGTLNYVLPTAFMTEDGSDVLRKYVLETHHILAFDGFENREGIFPDIDSRYKFGLLQIAKSNVSAGTDATRENTSILPPEKKVTRCRFMLTNPAELADDDRIFDYSLKDVQNLSQEHWAFMEVRGGQEDLKLLAKLYGKFPRISPLWIDFRRELDATNDKKLFKPIKGPEDLPLYKGACVWQYDSQYWKRTGSDLNKPQYWLNPQEFDDYLRDTEISRLIADVHDQLEMPDPRKSNEKNVLDALGLSQREELAQFTVPDRNYFRLGFRDIARDTDERTLISAVIPPNIGAQNKLPLSIPKKYRINNGGISLIELHVKRLFFAQAILNSCLVDWILRFSVAITVNKTYLMRLPVPQPNDDEIQNTSEYSELTKNSLLLSCAYNMEAFAPLLGKFELKEKNVPATQAQIKNMRVRNDVLVAQIYGVSKTEMEHMLNSFPVLAEKDPEYVIMLKESMS